MSMYMAQMTKSVLFHCNTLDHNHFINFYHLFNCTYYFLSCSRDDVKDCELAPCNYTDKM